MIRYFATLICALSLAILPGCATIGGEASAPRETVAPAPASAQAIAMAFAAADELAKLSAAARQSGDGCCQPGTPAAKRNADRLDAIARYLEAASAAQTIGNAGLASINLREALTLIDQLRALVIPAPAKGATR